jgi:hypothetical protein
MAGLGIVDQDREQVRIGGGLRADDVQMASDEDMTPWHYSTSIEGAPHVTGI